MRSQTMAKLARRVASASSLCGAAVAGALVGIWVRDTSSAHFNPPLHNGLYSFSGDDCMTRVDPVNVRFNGTGATARQVQSHADQHAVYSLNDFPEAWDTHTSSISPGGPQYFWDHDSCEPQDRESASNGGFLGVLPQPRYHMRYNEGDINGVLDFDPAVGGYYTLATAHHDATEYFRCLDYIHTPLGDIPYPRPSHVIDAGDPSGYDIARNRLQALWVTYGGHSATTEYWGNIDPMRQCNGDMVHSDGNALEVDLARYGDSIGGKAFLGF